MEKILLNNISNEQIILAKNYESINPICTVETNFNLRPISNKNFCFLFLIGVLFDHFKEGKLQIFCIKFSRILSNFDRFFD